MTQDRPDDEATSVFRPGGGESNEPVSLSKPGSDEPQPTQQASAGGYDPSAASGQQAANPYAQPWGGDQNPYGQSGGWGQQQSQPNPYAAQQGGYDPNNPYGQQAGQYGQQNPYGQQYAPQPGYDPNNPYAAQQGGYDPNNPYGQQAAYGQPAPYGQPYGMPGYQTVATNGMAIAALICSFFIAPLGLILGIIARKQIRETGEQGDGLALAGIIIGGVFTALGVLAIVFVIISIAAVGAAATSGGY